jgi:hypothetical protein
MFKLYFHRINHPGFIALFDLDKENNVPTFYSSLALLFSAILLWLIASIHRAKKSSSYLSWLGLSIIFGYLSIDEIASIHELLLNPVRNSLHTTGLLYFAWVIPYGILFVFFATAYLRFLLRLPRKTKVLFIVSGTAFVLGALGFELLGSLQFTLHGLNNLTYSILYTCEECLEMVSIAIFIYALLDYIAERIRFLNITLTSDNQVSEKTPINALTKTMRKN